MNLFLEEQVPEVRYLESLITSGLLEQYPSAYAKLPGQKVFLRMMTNTFKQIKGEK